MNEGPHRTNFGGNINYFKLRFMWNPTLYGFDC